MSRPPFRVYGCLWLILGLAFGSIAWFLWHRTWLAVGVGAVLGFVGLVVLVALGKPPPSPGRGPDDPRP
ncbi:MAG TPA: hypothetical protein VF950_25955 [Planctomycetota bacterium]